MNIFEKCCCSSLKKLCKVVLKLVKENSDKVLLRKSWGKEGMWDSGVFTNFSMDEYTAPLIRGFITASSIY